MLRILLLVFTSSLMLPCADASAQTTVDAQDRRPGEASHKQGRDIGTPEEEIIRRAQIKHEEDSHKELVARAGEMAQIGAELLDSFNKSKSLSRGDLKKLDRMEKLAHKIRSSAGASDDEEELEKPPAGMEEVVKRLAEVSGVLNKNVQKTSRLVISAAVIKNSNELIELIRRIKSLPHS
ncbi:MAG TPA: hypothetical protein VHU19_13470 [Pyrinomonadaceae bacterium]|jgi:hypothetical protein|nr:hypothetical protein [Pyrinomonadaceae bacterium]